MIFNKELRLTTSITVALIVVLSSFLTVYATTNNLFSDIDNHWAKEYILNLADKGIISGYPDGTFKPEQHLTKAEAIKLLITALGENPGIYENGHWALYYYNQALNNGYVLENEINNLDSDITRAEMARILARAITIKLDNIDSIKENITDFNSITDEFKEYVLKVYGLGIITGYPDGEFKPNNTLTRAEASTMLIRFLEPEKRETPKIINNEEQIIIDEKEVPVEAVEIIKPYYEVKTNLANIDGDNTSKYYNYLDEILIYYSPEGQAGYTNHTFSLTFYTLDDKEISVQYAGAMYGYDEKTYNAVKEVLKVFYPTGYEEAFKQIKNVAETKGFSGYSYIDNRKFGAKYFSERNSVCIYIGGEN